MCGRLGESILGRGDSQSRAQCDVLACWGHRVEAADCGKMRSDGNREIQMVRGLGGQRKACSPTERRPWQGFEHGSDVM